MVEIKCDGSTAQDCWECGKYFSSYSLHHCQIHKRKVSEISCSIGGNRTFDEDGKMIDGER